VTTPGCWPGLPGAATVAPGDIAGAIREGMLAFSSSAGLLVVQQLMAEDVTAKVDPKGCHDPQRTATCNGSAAARLRSAAALCPCTGHGRR
jgi:putative transposase